MKLKKPKKKKEKRQRAYLPIKPDLSKGYIWDNVGDSFYIIFLTIILLIALFVPSSKNDTKTTISNQNSQHASDKTSKKIKRIRIPPLPSH
ncbi:MAG: hypothetical protein FNT15_05195 [Sulfurovum sp.]|nr:MAG: hypothetical protein FNT15_05195 [Sulfurovum sp.]